MSNLIIDENYNLSDYASRIIDEFISSNSDVLDVIISDIYNNGGENRDVVLFGGILKQQIETEFLFRYAQEAIKRNVNTKVKNDGQIRG